LEVVEAVHTIAIVGQFHMTKGCKPAAGKV